MYNLKDNLNTMKSDVVMMRGIIRFGAPIEYDGVRYRDITDNISNQTEKVIKFQRNLMDFFINKFDPPRDGQTNLVVEFYSQDLISDEISELSLSDTFYAAFSVFFVFCYLLFDLKSFFLAFVGISLIGFSFGTTALIYQGVLRVTFFSNLNMLVIFIVLGTATNDVYIFMDAWRQSGCIEEYKGSYHMRMSYAFKRAFKTMAIASVARIGVFLANILSPMMAIQSFGIYAAIIIPVNFLLIIAMFPPAIIIYEQTFA